MISRMHTLQPDLDELEWHNDESLSGTSRGTGENREALGHLGHTEEVPVDLAPLVVGGELGRTLRSLHHDGSRDTAVETRSTARAKVNSNVQWLVYWEYPYPSFFTIFLIQSSMPL